MDKGIQQLLAICRPSRRVLQRREQRWQRHQQLLGARLRPWYLHRQLLELGHWCVCGQIARVRRRAGRLARQCPSRERSASNSRAGAIPEIRALARRGGRVDGHRLLGGQQKLLHLHERERQSRQRRMCALSSRWASSAVARGSLDKAAAQLRGSSHATSLPPRAGRPGVGEQHPVQRRHDCGHVQRRSALQHQRHRDVNSIVRAPLRCSPLVAYTTAAGAGLVLIRSTPPARPGLRPTPSACSA